MSKATRWHECRDKFLAAAGAGRTPSREHLKRWGSNKIAAQTDMLKVRAEHAAQNYALGGLLSVAVTAGKPANWAAGRIAVMLDRNDDLRLFDVYRRIGAVYVKFMPQRVQRAA